MDISVLIVNYNTADLVSACIESVLKQRQVTVEIIVVDNHSRDHSLAVLRAFGDRIKLIQNPVNDGFGKANNKAFRMSQGDFLFLLNPDAVLLTDLDLYDAVCFMKAHPECGLAGTRIMDSQCHVTPSASRYYPRERQTRADFSDLPGEWATVLGASMIIRRHVFADVGGFDENFFLYAEETDLCLRIRKHGATIAYADQITVQHMGSASERGNPPAEVIYKKKAGKYLFYAKHYPKSDVLKLVKQDLRHARFQLLRLRLQKHIIGLSQTQAVKLQRHQATIKLAKQFLKNQAT